MTSELKIKIKFKKKDDEAPTTVEISRKRLASDVTDAQDEEEEETGTNGGNYMDTTESNSVDEPMEDAAESTTNSKRRLSGEPKKKRAKHTRDTTTSDAATEKRTPSRRKAKASTSLLSVCTSDSVIQLIAEIAVEDVQKVFAYPVTDDIAPGYSQVIAQPMDFTTMEQKASRGEYANWQQVLDDFVLTFDNAMKFNVQSTFFYKEAKRLKKHVQTIMADRMEHNGTTTTTTTTTTTPKSSSKTDTKASSERKLNNIPANERKRLFSQVIDALRALDTNQIFYYPVPRDVPGYYEVITDPMDFSTLEKRMASRKVATFESFAEHIRRIFENAKKYNPEGTIYYVEAQKLLDAAEGKLAELQVTIEELDQAASAEQIAADEEEAAEKRTERRKKKAAVTAVADTNAIVDNLPAAEVVQRAEFPNNKLTIASLKELITYVMQYLKNADNYDIFSEPVSKEDVPEYYEVIKNPMTFSMINEKIQKDEYKTFTEFENDVELTFSNCKTFNSSHSFFWKEAARMQRILRAKLRKKIIQMLEEGKTIEAIKAALPITAPKVKASAEPEPEPEIEVVSSKKKKAASTHEDTFRKVVDELTREDKLKLFYDPVDVSEIPDYLTVIKTPMDFASMKKKANSGQYKNIDELKKDFELICQNATTYNKPSTLYYKEANRLLAAGLKKIEAYQQRLAAAEEAPSSPVASDDEGKKKRLSKKEKAALAAAAAAPSTTPANKDSDTKPARVAKTREPKKYQRKEVRIEFPSLMSTVSLTIPNTQVMTVKAHRAPVPPMSQSDFSTLLNTKIADYVKAPLPSAQPQALDFSFISVMKETVREREAKYATQNTLLELLKDDTNPHFSLNNDILKDLDKIEVPNTLAKLEELRNVMLNTRASPATLVSTIQQNPNIQRLVQQHQSSSPIATTTTTTTTNTTVGTASTV